MRPRAVLVLLTLLAAGCSKRAAGEPTAFRVVLLLAGPENDEGWNQSAYEGLQRIRVDLGAETRKITARSQAEIQRALAQAAAQGADLVVGHGFEFNGPAADLAPAHPGIAFVTTGGTRTGDNLATLVLRLEEAAWELGVLAAHLSRTGTLSAISGEAFEPVQRVVEGFRRGALSVNPDVKVLVEYLGSWEDSTLAKEKAFTHTDAGADVFFQNADAAGVGIFEACRARGTVAFGCNRDQRAKAPDVIVASAVADIPQTLLSLAREVQEGRFRGGVRSFGTREGKVEVAVNPDLAERVSDEARRAMEAARAAILAGRITPSSS